MSGEIIRRIAQLEKALDPNVMAREAYSYFRDITPVRTGNAQRRTRLSGDENDSFETTLTNKRKADHGSNRKFHT